MNNFTPLPHVNMSILSLLLLLLLSSFFFLLSSSSCRPPLFFSFCFSLFSPAFFLFFVCLLSPPYVALPVIACSPIFVFLLGLFCFPVCFFVFFPILSVLVPSPLFSPPILIPAAAFFSFHPLALLVMLPSSSPSSSSFFAFAFSPLHVSSLSSPCFFLLLPLPRLASLCLSASMIQGGKRGVNE